MSDTSTSPVSTERHGPVLVAHLDDGKVNAVSTSLVTGITAAVREAEADDDIRALVLNGRPGKFSAGFDLSVVTGDDPDAARALVADGGMLAHTLYGSSIPVVAACTGHALAAGAIILSGCDVRIGPDGPAKIGMTEVAIGMAVPEWAITVMVERLSRRHVQRSLANSQVYDPAGAVDAGFLDEVVPVDQVLPRALEVATGLATTLDPKAYAITIRRLRGAMLDTLAQQASEFRKNGAL